MVSNRIKLIILVYGMLSVASLSSGCSTQTALEEIPATVADPVQSNRQSTEAAPVQRTLPPPTNTPSSPAISPSPSATLEADPSVSVSELYPCDDLSENEETADNPSQQEGLSMAMDSLIAPSPPAQVQIALSDEIVVLNWNGTGTDVDQFYHVYLLREGGMCWELMAETPVEGDNRGVYSFEVSSISQANSVHYAVTTVDIYGNESDLSIASGKEPNT